MKVLFLDPEQYVSYENEPSYYELKLPVLNCGVVTDHRDFVYQRIIRQQGHAEMQRQLLTEFADYQPDLVIYSTTWPEYLVESWVLREIMDSGTPIYTHLWDTFPQPWRHELQTFQYCNYMGVTGTVSNYLFYKALAAGNQQYLRGVVFTAGHNVFTDLFQRHDLPKTSDVTLLGSREGARKQLIRSLENRVTAAGYRFTKAGGMLDSDKQMSSKGLRLSDDWVSWPDYIKTINQSKICVNSQSDPGRVQVKGKVFDYLACGAMVLTDRNIEICKVVPEDCVLYYDDTADCLDKIHHYLAHEDERLKVAARGHAWYHQTFDYKRFWSAVLTKAVTGEGELPGLPGAALHGEPEWTRQLLDLSPAAATAHTEQSFAPILIPRVTTEQPGDRVDVAAPFQRGERVPCALPWYKLEIGLDASYGPCCKIRFPSERAPASREQVRTMWNSKPMLELRQKMLDGRIGGTPCEGCYDRFFTTDHDILGMNGLPRYSLADPHLDALWAQANALYEDQRVVLPNLPLEINYLTSELCNLKCVMCTQNIDRTLQDTDRMFSLLADMGLESFDRFSWVGGEPFLTQDAIELTEYVAEQGSGATCIYITTNATLVHKHMATLDRIDHLFLTISIDGAGEAYEVVRQNSTWSQLRQNLELLKEHRDRHPNWRLNINSVVMRSTYRHVIELIDLAEHLGASIFFMPINGGLADEDLFAHPEILEDPEDFRQTIEAGIAHARARGADKARDTLEKLLEFWRLTRASRLPGALALPASTQGCATTQSCVPSF